MSDEGAEDRSMEFQDNLESKIKGIGRGDIVKLKKPHPCGSSEWENMRVGADFRLKCMGCGHQVMVPRKLVEKNDRGLTKKQA